MKVLSTKDFKVRWNVNLFRNHVVPHCCAWLIKLEWPILCCADCMPLNLCCRKFCSMSLWRKTKALYLKALLWRDILWHVVDWVLCLAWCEYIISTKIVMKAQIQKIFLFKQFLEKNNIFCFIVNVLFSVFTVIYHCVCMCVCLVYHILISDLHKILHWTFGNPTW
jgi:hypothetical protein